MTPIRQILGLLETAPPIHSAMRVTLILGEQAEGRR